jgi:F0F1-type ATP synthase membrane subunit c/vacuolar-type H+-ATPase subunit K
MNLRAFFIGFWLIIGLSLCGQAYAQSYNPDQSIAKPSEFVKVANFSLGEILKMDVNRLIALGAGIIVGATVIAPYFEFGEVTGIAVGVLIGAIAYQTWASQQSSWYSF